MDASPIGLESPGTSLLARKDVKLETKTERHTEDATRHLEAKVEQHVRLRIRQDEDGDVELRLRAQFEGEFSSVIRSGDRDQTSETVLKVSQSVKARVDIDVADDANPEQVRSALAQLTERFSTVVDSLASAVRDGTTRDPLALIGDLRNAFDSLTSGLTEAFAPAIAAAAPIALPTAPTSAPVPPPVAPSPVATGGAPVQAPAAAEADAAPSSRERSIRLRADLRASFATDFRHVLDRLARREPEPLREREREDGEHDEHTRHPAERLHARFDLRQKLTFHLLDTRA